MDTSGFVRAIPNTTIASCGGTGLSVDVPQPIATVSDRVSEIEKASAMLVQRLQSLLDAVIGPSPQGQTGPPTPKQVSLNDSLRSIENLLSQAHLSMNGLESSIGNRR